MSTSSSCVSMKRDPSGSWCVVRDRQHRRGPPWMREPRRWGFSVSRSEYFQVSVIIVAVVSQRSTRQMLVHRRRNTPARAAGQHRDVVGRGTQPRHEPGDMLHGDLIDTHAHPGTATTTFRLVAYVRTVVGD